MVEKDSMQVMMEAIEMKVVTMFFMCKGFRLLLDKFLNERDRILLKTKQYIDGLIGL